MPPDPEDTRRLVAWRNEQAALPPTQRQVYANVKRMLEVFAMRGGELAALDRKAPRGNLSTWFACQLERVEGNTRTLAGGGAPLPFEGCTRSDLFDERVSGIICYVHDAMRDVQDAPLLLAAARFNRHLEEWKEAVRHRRMSSAPAEACRLLEAFESCRKALFDEMDRPDIR